MNNAINAVLSKPDLYSAVLIDMVQKLGFTAAIALVLVVFLMLIVIWLLRHSVAGYKESIRYLNDQNKRYQDYFLDDRGSSGKKFLGEGTDKKDQSGKKTAKP